MSLDEIPVDRDSRLSVVSAVPRTTVRASRPTWLGAVVSGVGEVLLVGGLFVLYRLGRLVVTGRENIARTHAATVHDLEALLHLPSEAAIQSALPDWLLHGANVYYVALHFPVTIAFLVWGYFRRPRSEYRWARNLLVVQTFLALVIHIAYPLAPPRMFPQWGFTDTMTELGPSAYDGASAAVANQFAAMPSLHIGWSVLIAVVLCRTASRRLALAGVGHALLTAAVVVVTANHWWLDGFVAVLLLAVGLLLLPLPDPRRKGRIDDRKHRQELIGPRP